MVMREGAPYTMARLIERRFVPTIYFGDLGGALFSSSVSLTSQRRDLMAAGWEVLAWRVVLR